LREGILAEWTSAAALLASSPSIKEYMGGRQPHWSYHKKWCYRLE
jgi:hypothetical protein